MGFTGVTHLSKRRALKIHPRSRAWEKRLILLVQRRAPPWGRFRWGDPADPKSGALAGTHEQPLASPARPCVSEAGHPLLNIYRHRPGRTSVPACQRRAENCRSASPT